MRLPDGATNHTVSTAKRHACQWRSNCSSSCGEKHSRPPSEGRPGPLTDSSVPAAVRQILDAKGYRLTLDEPAPACELWIRNSVPALPKKDGEGLAYPQLAESTLVGVIRFSQPAADFRGQRIRAGFYTLRYELIPNDG